MEITPVQNICQNLIYYAIQRCRISENLCRLSIVLKPSPDVDPPTICISNTGAGSSLEEFQDLNHQFCRDGGRIHVFAGKWDGVLSIITTGIQDKEIHHYRFSLGVTVPTERLTRLASTPKNRCKFSGTEVGTGLAHETENLRSTGLIVEAVILITKMPETSNTSCLRAYGTKTEVLYFQDFSPSSIPHAYLNALTSIDWHSYGLILRDNIMDCSGNAVLEWENLTPAAHIDVVLHSYHNKVMLPQSKQSVHAERRLAKKAVKLALDEIKVKYTGLLLSTHALKIQKHVPHLSRAIAGLILSSNDLEFQGECASLLGLLPPDVLEEGRLESCIREKIDGIIEMNDRMPKRGREDAQYLFEEEKFCADGEQYEEEDDEGDEDAGVGVWDL